MKKIILIFFVLPFANLQSQVTQFPQVYFNNQGIGGSSLYIHQSPSLASTNVTSLAITSQIGAENFATSNEVYGPAVWAKVCLPSTTGNIRYGYMMYGQYYIRIAEQNNYATVTAISLNIRPCAGCTSSNITIGGQNAMFGQGSILALTGTVSSGWYEVYLTTECSQYTGWVSGTYLSLNTNTQNYYNVGGSVNNNLGGSLWGATINMGAYTTSSTEGFYQYKLPIAYSGTITCSSPNYNTSSPTNYSHTANNHIYNRDFILSNNSCSTPTLQSNNISFSGIGNNSIYLSWSSGDGGGRILVAKANSPISSTPTNGIIYSASNSFGNGNTIGTGEYVVYNSSGNNVTVTNLNSNTTYYFRLFEYNCNPIQYNTSVATSNPNFQTTTSNCSGPSIQATNVGFSNISTNQLTLNWNPGNGSNRIVVAKANSTISGNPTNGILYSANNTFGLGDFLNPGEYIVYSGSGNNVTVYGLSPSIQYFFKVFEFSCSPEIYLTTNGAANPGNQTTSSSCIMPTIQANGINFSNITSTQMTINWNNGNGGKRIVVINTLNSFSSLSNGNEPIANANYIGSGEQTVYNGIGNNVTVSGLTANTTYWFRVFEGNCSGNNSIYNFSTAGNNPISQITTINIPTINSITFTNSIQNHPGLTPLYTIYSGSAYIANNPVKICADGSASTYFKVNTSNTAGISFRLIDGSGQPISDPQRDGQIGSINVFVNNVEVQYTHPQYMNWAGTFRQLYLQVLYNGIPISGISFPIEIYRAPVLMIHGFLANTFGGTTFDELENRLINFYNYYPASILYKKHYPDYKSFFDNQFALKDGINDLLQKARNDNYSIGAVDVVSHSMGGLLSRLYIQDAYGIQYRNDVHKFITLNTPHSGSPLPELLDTYCYVSLLIDWPIFSVVTCGIQSVIPAIRDLGVSSNAIDNILNGSSITKTNRVPTYAIITESLDPHDNSIGHILYNLPGLTSHFHGENHDVVVSESSQRGGIDPSYTFSNQFHIGSASNPIIISRVKEVLNAIPNNQNFDIDGYSPTNLFFIPALPTQSSTARSSSQDSILINSPANNSSFNPGDTINVSVVGTQGIEKLYMSAGNKSLPFFAKDTSLSSFTFKYNVPQEAIGEIRIIAVGTTSDNEIIDFDTLRINVQPVFFDSISADNSSIFLAACSDYTLSINGYYNGGLKKDISYLGNVLYQISDTNIASFISPNIILGKQPGLTVVSISYGGNSIQIPIEVYSGEDWFTSILSTNNPTVLCEGDTAIVTSTAADYFLWNTGDTTQSISISSTGQYYVSVGNICGMTANSDTINFVFNPMPIFSVSTSGPTTFCQGDSVLLSVNSAGNYYWSNGENIQSINVKSTGYYSVTVSDSTGCSNTSVPIEVIVNPKPYPLINGPASICPGAPGVVYSIASVGNIYNWSLAGAMNFQGQFTNTIIVDWDTLINNYIYIQETDSVTGCKGETTLNINADSVLRPIIIPRGLVTACIGDTIPLNANSGYASYLWNTGDTTQSIAVSISGAYSVTVSLNGCSGTSNLSTTVHLNQPNDSSSIIMNGDTLFSPYIQPINWYYLGNIQPIDSGYYHVCKQSGNYYVTGLDTNGCLATSSVISMNCQLVDMYNINSTISLSVFPNPSNGEFTISLYAKTGKVKLKVTNLLNQIIYFQEFNDVISFYERQINLNTSPGIYLLNLEIDNSIYLYKIIVE